MARTNLSELRNLNPEAFAAYVEMLVEECKDEFEVAPHDGMLRGYVCAAPGKTSTTLVWDPRPGQVTMDIGSSWRRETSAEEDWRWCAEEERK